MDMSAIEDRKTRARAWVEALRDDICAAFEKLEDERRRRSIPASAGASSHPLGAHHHSGAPGGGGVMARDVRAAVRKGRGALLDRDGEFAPEFRAQIPGAEHDPRFWASGISLIAHLRNPNVPAVHMNTRFVVTTKSWFGGGADLTPVLDAATHPGRCRHGRVSRRRQGRLRHPFAVAPYEKYKKWCDDYFYLPHRKEARGIGGIFDDWQTAATGMRLAFTRTSAARS